ncbi:endonuclease domain-containing protein [Microbacterium sp. RD1]|uniref:endonuclease domain-containing protein n=1 Tax=Microbacterium sp. RD1 TaxID=3457313 RepID=UPI003FA61148
MHPTLPPQAFISALRPHLRRAVTPPLLAGVTLGGMFVEFLHRAELVLDGMSRSDIAAAVHSGALVRARRDHYLPGDTDDRLVRAVRVGGRLTCLSVLQLLGVFVQVSSHLHVHMVRTASRMRSPHDRRQRLEDRSVRGVRLHWSPLHDPPGHSATVSVIDALVHSVLCQAPRAAIASLDSALYRAVISLADLGEVFARLPARFAVLRPLVDGRAESGPETLMRLMLRALGCSVAVQVQIEGVGRVDLVVDGWLVIECDSKEFHAGWQAQAKDRERDLRLAARGFTCIRPTAAMIMNDPEFVLDAVRGLLATRPDRAPE